MALKNIGRCTPLWRTFNYSSKTKKYSDVQYLRYYSLRETYSQRVRQKSKYLKPASFVIGGVSAISGVYYYQLSDAQRRKLRVSAGGVTRFLRSLRIGLLISLDYWWSVLGIDEDSQEYEQVISEIHQRAADRILIGCLQNGGLYIKLGQGLVSLNHILPKEYTKTLQKLQDKCLVRKKDEVLQLFLEDFGRPHTDMFKSFESEPIAAASLAQVYKAVTMDEKEVAVKVQYIDLQDRFVGDVSTVNVLLKLAALMHPKFNFKWILDELRDTLEQELDFVNEGKNSERCARDLSKFSFIHVPTVYWDLTTKRVLTTEFIYGTKINQVSTLKDAGFSLGDIDKKLFKAFAEQIFHSGFVHADPHPGNILVRRSKKDSKAELVLLDHGLYEYLPPDKRQSLCKLWKSIVLHDYDSMEQYSKQLGVKDDYRLFCISLCQKYIPVRKGDDDSLKKFWDRNGQVISISKFSKLTREEKVKLRSEIVEVHEKMLNIFQSIPNSYLFAEILMQRPLKLHKYKLKMSLSEDDMKYMTVMAKQRFDKIMMALRQMPNNMLLIIRNINTIRAIAKDHGDPVDRYTIMARSATEGVFDYKGAGLGAKLAGVRQRLLFEFRIWTDYIRVWLTSTVIRIGVYFGRIPDLRSLSMGH